MADKVTLSTKAREKKGSRDAAQLRKKGFVPVVVYGHKETPEHLYAKTDEVSSIIRHRVRNLELETAGKKQPVLVQSVQYDFLNRDVIHVDFRRVYADERIHATVPIQVKGIARGTMTGGVLDHPLHSLHIDCLASAVPEAIIVKVDDLLLGQVIHVRELHLPEGVKALGDYLLTLSIL